MRLSLIITVLAVILLGCGGGGGQLPVADMRPVGHWIGSEYGSITIGAPQSGIYPCAWDSGDFPGDPPLNGEGILDGEVFTADFKDAGGLTPGDVWWHYRFAGKILGDAWSAQESEWITDAAGNVTHTIGSFALLFTRGS